MYGFRRPTEQCRRCVRYVDVRGDRRSVPRIVLSLRARLRLAFDGHLAVASVLGRVVDRSRVGGGVECVDCLASILVSLVPWSDVLVAGVVYEVVPAYLVGGAASRRCY